MSYMLRLRPLILKLEISIISPRLLPVVDMSSGIFNYASYDEDQDLLIQRKKIAKFYRSIVAKESSDLYRHAPYIITSRENNVMNVTHICRINVNRWP